MFLHKVYRAVRAWLTVWVGYVCVGVCPCLQAFLCTYVCVYVCAALEILSALLYQGPKDTQTYQAVISNPGPLGNIDSRAWTQSITCAPGDSLLPSALYFTTPTYPTLSPPNHHKACPFV